MACGDFCDRGFLFWGFSLDNRTGSGLEVLQDIIVDLRGDLLLLQHLSNGLVCSVGPDRRVPLHGSTSLSGIQTNVTFGRTTKTWRCSPAHRNER